MTLSLAVLMLSEEELLYVELLSEELPYSEDL
jgi:hypothetical protein